MHPCAGVMASTSGRNRLGASFKQALVRYRSTVTSEAVLTPKVREGARTEDWTNAKPYSEIPGPKPIPFLGNVWRFVPGVGDLAGVKNKDMIKELTKRSGPIVKLSGLPGKPDVIFLADADAVEKVTRSEGPWPVRQGSDSLDYYLMEVRSHPSLIASQGKEWQEFRSAVNQVLMQPRNVRIYINPINTVAEEFMDRIWTLRDEAGEMPDDFRTEMAKFTLETIAFITLDTRLGTLANDLPQDSEPYKMIRSIEEAFQCIQDLDFKPSLWRFVSTPTYRRLIKCLDYFNGVAHKHVSNAIERLQALSPAEREDREYSVLERILIETDDTHRAVSMGLDMMLAGVDTTATQLSVLMYNLAINPDKQRLLQKELDRVIPDPSQPLTFDQLEQMKYLRACIKEGTRMEAVIPAIGRTTIKDMAIMGYQIPKGTRMVMCHNVMAMDEKYFPRAKEFLPERHLPGGESLKATHPFSHLPFGFGPRRCVGKRFADLEMEVFLAKLFRRYDLEWNYPPPESDVMLTTTYTTPLKFKIEKRAWAKP